MISGSVNANQEAIIRLSLQDIAGQEHKIDAVVDTGFTGFLTLPSYRITKLEFPWIGRAQAILGDGNEYIFDVYVATVIWDGQPLRVAIAAADTTPLVGMKMLHGFELIIQAIEGGSVTIKPLPQESPAS